jgi:hypothetical protein
VNLALSHVSGGADAGEEGLGGHIGRILQGKPNTSTL